LVIQYEISDQVVSFPLLEFHNLFNGSTNYLFVLQIVSAEKASKGDMQEKLTMTVAVPLLWGVPPASERIHLAVRNGGGIVDKVFWRWDFL